MITNILLTLHKKVSILLVFVLFAILHSSVSYGAKPIRLGATISSEGKYAKLSYMVKHGYEVWVRDINKRGGLLGRKVQLITYDDKSDKKLVGPLYEKLIVEDKVDLVLSPYSSTLTMEAAEVAEKYGYVLLAATASSIEIWERGFKNIFGVYSTADRYFIGFLDLAARERMKNVGIIYSNTTFNISAAEGSRKWASLFGLKVPFFEMYNDYQKDLPEIVKMLQNQKVENLLFCGYPSEGYLFLELLQKYNIQSSGLALTIIPALPDFYSIVGNFAEGIFGPSQWEADNRLPFPGVSDFIQNFTALTGKKPSYQACSSYSACQIFEKAIKQAGVINHTEIRNFVTNLDTITIMGRFKVDIDGRQIGHNPIIIQWQNGKKEIVYPTKMRTALGKFKHIVKD